MTYEWWVSDNEPEGTHYFHSHGNTRLQTARPLRRGHCGAQELSPPGPSHGEPLSSGWAAIIQDPRGPAFREFAFYYHEVGNERYRHLDRQGLSGGPGGSLHFRLPPRRPGDELP